MWGYVPWGSHAAELRALGWGLGEAADVLPKIPQS